MPQMLTRVQRSSGRQVLLSTHSNAILDGGGIDLNEVLLLEPNDEGTKIHKADEFEDIRLLLDSGIRLGEVIMPKTEPENAYQLTLFGDQK